MKPCRFTFDETPAFDGFAHGSKWNGFDNVAVTRAQLETIMRYFTDTGDLDTVADMMAITPMDGNAIGMPDIHGLISLGWGYTTSIVEQEGDTYQDVLDVLASVDGACLYWQLGARAKAALEAGVVTIDENDLMVHPRATRHPEGGYTMPEEG
jgi:hypothetical protein